VRCTTLPLERGTPDDLVRIQECALLGEMSCYWRRIGSPWASSAVSPDQSFVSCSLFSAGVQFRLPFMSEVFKVAVVVVPLTAGVLHAIINRYTPYANYAAFKGPCCHGRMIHAI
jgi:hypothetical protein